MGIVFKKFSVIILSLAGVAGMTLISPVMTSLAAEFPGIDSASIAMVVTLPAFTILPALFLTSALVTKVERMWINTTAFLFVVAGGVLPAFLNSFLLILVCRGVLGLGMGMLMPIQSTYIAEFPEGERAGIFGWSQGINSIISSLLVVLVGVISVNNWRNAFLLYGIFIIVFIIVFFGIPRTGALGSGTEGTAKAQEGTKGKIGGRFVLFCVSQFLAQTCNIAMMSSFSFFVEANGLGGTQLASNITSAGIFVLAVGSILLPRMLGVFKSWSGVVFLGVSAGAFLLLSLSNPIAAAVGYCLVYTFVGLYSTYISITITQILPLQLVALGSSISTASIFVGQFISPMVQKLVADSLHVQPSSPMVFVAFAVLTVAVAVINLPFFQRARNASN